MTSDLSLRKHGERWAEGFFRSCKKGGGEEEASASFYAAFTLDECMHYDASII